MDKKTISYWIMYHQIRKMHLEGSTFSQIATFLGLDRRTVKKYYRMTEREYEDFLNGRDERSKFLSPYESFVKEKLLELPSASTAQIHDWLKEHHNDFPATSPRTVYNFAMWVRQKYQIVLEDKIRDYMRVEEKPYGEQGQADFGQYTLRTSDGRKKVWFFSLVLSASRYKYVCFSDRPFTTKTAIDAHEAAFKFFEGVPKEVVYDQDRLFLVDENLGNLLLTREFKTYVFERDYSLYFCRKADPQSKGKIENVIGYIKKNFLYGRLYHDIEILQSQTLDWLCRTGNAMVHGTTKKIPAQEWEQEKPYLSNWAPIRLMPDYILATVLKDNVFNYKGNSYSVPSGTYKGKGTYLNLRLQGDNTLMVYSQQDQLLCRHERSSATGKFILNTDHKRDKSLKIQQLIEQTAALFADQQRAFEFLGKVKERKPRYARDQVQAIRDALSNTDATRITAALEGCISRNLFDATAFKDILQQLNRHSGEPQSREAMIKLLDPANLKKAEIRPKSSDINLYENLFTIKS
ncbi:MAG: IS21 family transposase [Daejeonella sp.]